MKPARTHAAGPAGRPPSPGRDRQDALLGCVIMASGEGRRFGSSKLMADFGGRPMLEWVLDAAEGVFSRWVVVTRHLDIKILCQRRQVPVVLHSLPSRSDTVRLGLTAVGLDLSGCMFCPGDQPLLSRESVQAMAQCAAQDPEHIWRLAYSGEAGAPVLFPQWAFSRLMALPPGKGGSVILGEYPEQVRLTSARRPYELRDVDTPKALKDLEGCLRR